ncbi:MAG: HAD-IG family 5'-nucleotidase [Thermoanaerobaculia bacterium]|nr:HAD-IG family 5'-nucleotidase [Thermoanaerobaculia bacterium]
MKDLPSALGDDAPPLLRRALKEEGVPLHRRIFVNRTLRMETIRCIGFDLDWTLASYRRVPVQELIFELSVDRLVDRLGYSPAIRRAEFRPGFPHRGLIVDREAGTVLKMNRHRYVSRAYLGRERLARDERARLYRKDRLNLRSDRFYWVDTLFELPEVNLFGELVELGERGALDLPPFDRLFQDVRSAVDGVHDDGPLKRKIRNDPDRFLRPDPDLPLALERLRLGDRCLLLITNSSWEYTDGLCGHLFETEAGPDSWTELFDLVIVEADKPDFFRSARPFQGLDARGDPEEEVETPSWNGIYRGGSLDGVRRLLGIPGEQVLYVGDHIYGDIVSSKLSSTWRTALVVQELEDELLVQQEQTSERRRLSALKSELAAMGQQMDDLRDVLNLYRDLSERDPGVEETIRRRHDALHRDHKILRGRARELRDSIAERHNRAWGSVFQAGGSQSLFGSQVRSYSCLYTSRVSNFVGYGTDHYYRVLKDPMAHDL